MYQICWEKIKIANINEKNDIIYKIPLFIADCIDYNPLSCLEYIELELRKLSFDTLKLNNCSIFISWIYLEVNLHTINST